jgi:hypothetical protein
VKRTLRSAVIDSGVATTRSAIAATALGLVLIWAAIGTTTPAGATFSGTTSGGISGNGNVAFAAICNATIGQAVYSLDPNVTSTTYSCPSGTPPNYTQSSAGSIDSMPYFDSSGTQLYFSSNRLASANNPGAGGNYAIYWAPYPPTVSGSPPNQTDNATQITFPGSSSNDYAPTVSMPASGQSQPSEMTFIRCNGTSTSCALYVQSPVVGGSPTLVPTSVPVSLPNSVSGEASRPEINPNKPDQVEYVGTDQHIHLLSLSGAFSERDLSAESGIGTGLIDEYPDWNPAGTRIIFDRSHSVFVLDPTTSPATTCQLWGTDPGHEIEPLFAPTDTAVSSPGTCNPTGNMYVWTTLGGGSNITLDEGHLVGNPDVLDSLTANKTNNSQTAWQPVQNPGSATPEVSMALMLPGAALVIGGLALVLERRRRRAAAV